MIYPPLLSSLFAVLAGVLLAQGSARHDVSILVAHRRVLEAIDALPREQKRILESDEDACSICYGGADPHNPNRELISVDQGNDDGDAALVQPPLTCAEYSTTFLTQLFASESSCLAFQGSSADICGCPRPPSLCTLCDFGLPPSDPDHMLPVGTVGNSAPISCSDWDTASAAVYVEGDAECDATRSAGLNYCGCPEPCHLCPEGYRLVNPTSEVDDSLGLVSTFVRFSDEYEDDYPTCRDAENAAAISAIFSSGTATVTSPYGENVFDESDGSSVLSTLSPESNICELYKDAFGGTCGCLAPAKKHDGCHVCDNGLMEPDKGVRVELDGMSVRISCANIQNFALVGLGGDVCSQISPLACPCKDEVAINPVAASVIKAEATSSASMKLDSVGISLLFSAVIVAFATLM